MLKRRLKKNPLSKIEDPDDRIETLANWTANDQRHIEIEVALVLLALFLGALSFYFYLQSVDDRRREVNDKLNNLACLALHYIPPGTQFYQDLQSQFPDCPPYRSVGPPPSPSPSKSSHSPGPQAGGTPTLATPTPGGPPPPGGSSGGHPKGTTTVHVPGGTVTDTTTKPGPTATTTRPGPTSITTCVPVPVIVPSLPLIPLPTLPVVC